MTSRLILTLTLLLALTSTALGGDTTCGGTSTSDGTGTLTAAERATLAAQPTADVLSLRAGASEEVPSVSVTERTQLAQAAASADDLDALRAGEEDNHNLEIAGAVVGMIVLAILIF